MFEEETEGGVEISMEDMESVPGIEKQVLTSAGEGQQEEIPSAGGSAEPASDQPASPFAGLLGGDNDSGV